MRITANSAQGSALAYFRPNEVFNWIKYDDDGIPTVMGRYTPKFEYTVRTQELMDKVREWESEDKVKVVEA